MYESLEAVDPQPAGCVTQRAAAARITAVARSQRIAPLDMARGLLVLLMASSHALTLSGAPQTSFWYSPLWLPRGWATFSFTILSGFTMAMVLPWATERARAHRIVWRRAAQVLIIFVASNALFELARAASTASLGEALAASWWIGLLTFNTAYGLSAVLLPITLLLIIAPVLYWCRGKLGWAGVTAGVAALTLAVWWLPEAIDRAALPRIRAIDILFYEGLGGFVVAPLLTCGALGFCLGLRGPNLRSGHAGRSLAVCLAAALALRLLLQSGVGPELVWAPALTLAYFAIVLFLAALLVGDENGGVLAPLALIGRYALFSFLVHRAILQAMALVIVDRGASASHSAVYLALFSGTMCALWGLCLARSRMPHLDGRLKTVGL